MNNFKFRAWPKSDLEKGNFLKYRTVYSNDTGRFEYSPNMGHHPYTQSVGHVLASADWVVEPATGLLTKDGGDIYVGDIVEFEGIVGEVQFLSQQNGYAVITHNSDYRLVGWKYSVIGNIHENKEMLKCHIK